MRIFSTIITAICPISGQLLTFCGPNIPSISRQNANDYCQTHGLGYCRVDAEIIEEIPCKSGGYEPDFDNAVNYQNLN